MYPTGSAHSGLKTLPVAPTKRIRNGSATWQARPTGTKIPNAAASCTADACPPIPVISNDKTSPLTTRNSPVISASQPMSILANFSWIRCVNPAPNAPPKTKLPRPRELAFSSPPRSTMTLWTNGGPAREAPSAAHPTMSRLRQGVPSIPAPISGLCPVT